MKRRAKAFLLVVLPISFIILAGGILLLFPRTVAHPSSVFDYVDNNVSDVDASPDKGIHSNFTAQQYGPDSIYDTLTEENTGGGVGWGNNTQPNALILETDPDLSGSAATYATYGLNNLVSDDSTYGGGDVQDCGMVNDPQEVSLIMEFDYSGLGISGSDVSYLRFEAEVYFIGGTGRAPTNDPWEMATTFYDGSVEIYNWDSGSWEIMGTVFIDDPADLSIWDQTGDVNPERPLIRYKDSGFSDAYMNPSGYIRIRIQITGVFQGTAYDGCSVIDYVDVDLQYGEENYELDLEVQWTSATYDITNKELCIYGGTMGSENILVDVWTGSTWQNLFTDLTSGWHNISVTDYLIASTFTVRFKGETETGDTSQDSWEIDSTLLHTWGISPTASFSYIPEYPYPGETVTFNSSDSYDPDGTIVSHEWDFGDGANGTGEIASHIYADDGTYTVTLNVTDNHGLSDITSTDITVLNRLPIAIFTESATTVIKVEVIYFNASDSYDPDGTIVSYFWDFGDGTNATGVTTEHAYADVGFCTVTLTVTDDDGATASTSATKTVGITPPVAIFTESAETVYTGEVITFNATESYDPDGTIVSYEWDFGDGTNATGVIVDYAYTDDGNYVVTLTVTDDDSAPGSTSATKTILNRPPVPSFTESAETMLTGDTITFNASTSYDPDGSVVSYFWDFGDGTNSTGVVVEHAYADDGVYNVTLTVTDDDGTPDKATSTKTVQNRPPIATFTESAETVYTGDTITFNASASYDPDGTIVSYFWDFGDGTNATGVVVEHAYADEGNYSVTLTVTEDDGATDIATSAKTILNRPPMASFSETAETVYTSEVVTFNASASYDSDGYIVSYFWDLGDGTNTTGVVVAHSYADDGVFTALLTVTDNDGATESTSATKTVLNTPPVASFTYSPSVSLVNQTVTFNATASYDPDGYIVSYFWEFDDGTNGTGEIVTHAYAAEANYTVTLTVTDDDGATDTATDIVTVILVPRDVAVLSVEPSANEAYPTWVVPLNITVVVENQGPWPETFDLTIYCNETAIETKTVTLASNANTTLIFNWNVTGAAEGIYIVRAEAGILLGETDTVDNSLTNGAVKLKHPGDANDDGAVDAHDLAILAKAWQTSVGDPDYDPRADFNGDGTVDEQDEEILQQYWP